MTGTISGLHHITVISGNAQRNLNFYANVLGLRFIKKTVNFDDPSVYHLYYGDEVGTPGTVLTFFPWEHMRLGRRGVGEASLTQFSIPPGSLPFWRERLERAGAPVAGPTAVFGEERLVFEDPDGMKAALVVATDRDQRTPWTTSEIGEDSAIRGFHGVTLSLADHTATAELLTALLGYEAAGKEGNTYRYACRPRALPASWTSSSCRAASPRYKPAAASTTSPSRWRTGRRRQKSATGWCMRVIRSRRRSIATTSSRSTSAPRAGSC